MWKVLSSGAVVKRVLEFRKVTGTPPFGETSEVVSDAPKGHEVIANQLKEALFGGRVGVCNDPRT